MQPPIPTFDIPQLELLESLSFTSLDTSVAVELGMTAVRLIQKRNLSLAVDIVLHDDLVFRAKLGATDSTNNEWLAGKAAVTRHFGEPSLLVKLRHLQRGTPFEQLPQYDHSAMRAFGGSVPLRIGGQVVGTLTASGEPDVIDHDVAETALRLFHSVCRAAE